MKASAGARLAALRAAAAARPGEGVAADGGERAADWVAGGVGSWRFVIAQSLILAIWIAAKPILLLSQNRRAELGRRRAIEDLEINQKAECEIETLHAKSDSMRRREVAALTASVERLTRLIESERLQP
jgi:uncharacterized membrane protein